MKRTLFLITIIFIALNVSVSAQNIKRGYKSLEKKEYDKALDIFKKALGENKDDVAANFGVALIKADDQSPLFDIIDAWQYIVRIKGRENELSQEEIEILGEYFLNTEVRKTSRPVKKKIEIAEEAIDARLIKYIREENNLDAVYRVLEMYPDYKHHDNVVHIRNQFEFRKYEKLNTKAGYEEFIKKFPDAAQVPKAENYRNKMAFEEVKAKNTIEAYNTYIKSYPDSKYLQSAIKLRNAKAYSEAEAKNTLQAYNNFIEFYPDALEISKAKQHQHQLMYEKAKRIKSLEAYNEFIKMYPDGAYYLDVFNLKAGDLGMQYFRNLDFNSPDFIFAKALDNNEQIDKASSIAETKDGGYIVAGTTQKSESDLTDAWIVKLDNKGAMLWNKTIGQPFNDVIKKVLVTSENECIVIGYTQIASDSAQYVGWMFKLGTDGKPVWNKNLGSMEIAACAISPDNKIYLATYIKDTIPDNYYWQAYNSDGIKVWERSYVKQGTFNDILFTDEGKAFLAGSKWFTMLDSKLYLDWDDSLSIPAVISHADMNSQNIILTASDSLNQYFYNYSITGKQQWLNTKTKNNVSDSIEDVTITDRNNMIILGEMPNNNYLVKYDGTGKKISEKTFFDNYRPVDILKTKEGKIAYLFEGDDYLITVFSSAGF